MKPYKKRKIAYHELIEIDGWKIKCYQITKKEAFTATANYNEAVRQLPEWLAMKNNFDDSHNKIGFLIVHQGTEGVFCIVNWWVGEEMLNTHIFLSGIDSPSVFKKVSGTGLAPCIWELEVINFERVTWIDQVLKKKPADFDAYLGAHFSCLF